MSLFVKVENNEITQIGDAQPTDEPAWLPAIEVRPPIISHRQYYTEPTFDLTKTPIEIVYGVVDIHLKDRKVSMKSVVTAPQPKDTGVLITPLIQKKLKAIDACVTHSELDALM